MISPGEHAELSVSTYVTRAVAVNQYLAECCGGAWIFAAHSSPLDRCHCEMDMAEEADCVHTDVSAGPTQVFPPLGAGGSAVYQKPD